jgi:hypothetical protein
MGVAAAFACAVGLPLVIWSASGMETAAFALVLLVCVSRLAAAPADGGWGRAGIWGGVVAAMRPEGFLPMAAAAFAAGRFAPERRWAAVRFLLGAGLVIGPLVLGRLVYFGDWLPNPARAKAPEGLATLAPGALATAKWLASFPLACLAVVPWWRARRTEPLAAIGLAAIAAPARVRLAGGRRSFPGLPLRCAGVAAVRDGDRAGLAVTGVMALCRLARARSRGGRGMALRRAAIAAFGRRVDRALAALHLEPSAHAARLVAELRHVGFVAAGVAIWLASKKRPFSATPAGFLLLLACLVLPMAFDPQIRVCRREDAAAQFGRPVGEWLRAQLPPDALVATNAAGALPYFSDLPTLDMLGLTDRHIARSRPDRRQWVGHERGDGAYVLSRRPRHHLRRSRGLARTLAVSR